MIRVILIDDERPALKQLEADLSKFNELVIAGMYTNPLQAINDMESKQPDAVFLDIHMPQLRGIDAASEILARSPSTDIIFVTAYDEYAVEAFELYALDYLLKPVESDRLERTIKRLTSKKGNHVLPKRKQLIIQCMGSFQISWEGKEPIKWRTKKTKELMAFLVHHRGKTLSKELIIEELWPEVDLETATRQLYNGIYYVRKNLENYGVDLQQLHITHNYRVVLGEVVVDVDSFFEMEKKLFATNLQALEQASVHYKDGYLKTDYYSWAYAEQERVASIYQECLLSLAGLYSEKKDWKQAEITLQKAYNHDPYEERITVSLMKLYQATENYTKASRHFTTYRKQLKDELNIEPSASVGKLYRSIIG